MRNLVAFITMVVILIPGFAAQSGHDVGIAWEHIYIVSAGCWTARSAVSCIRVYVNLGTSAKENGQCDLRSLITCRAYLPRARPGMTLCRGGKTARMQEELKD
jgi:hypothetical protein